jgi:thiamine phosphate synthase YjbQ (UPF0047 family)
MPPRDFALAITPRARFDLVDVAHRLRMEWGDQLSRYRKTVYCSYHTTAGYLEQSLCARLQYSRERLAPFIRAFQRLFPQGAHYRHDQLEERTELTDEERLHEPRNADSHLTFIGSGLRNCVTYVNRAETPVYFIDLDGIHEKGVRTRRTRILAYDEEDVLARRQITVPVSRHPIDSVNLKDPRLGLWDQVLHWVEASGVEQGRVDIVLEPGERHTGLTVNEFETLLMRNDLAEVLRDPLRLLAQDGRRIWKDPVAIPSKTLGYAQYDLVQVFNELMDAFHASESAVEKILAGVIRVPASRFLRLKRQVSFLISDGAGTSRSRIVQGRYQSPILVQWQRAEQQVRRLDVVITSFR